MEKMIQISLSGNVTFQASEAAYNLLSGYLERARLRLKDDPDHEEVMRDLEQAIGEKLKAKLPSNEHVLNVSDLKGVLADIGPVDTGRGDFNAPHAIPPGRRRLVRIKEGQDIFGVCQGLAAYSDISVDWVRWIFVILTIFTGGVLAIVYLAMGFILPVVATRDEYVALHFPRREGTSQ